MRWTGHIGWADLPALVHAQDAAGGLQWTTVTVEENGVSLITLVRTDHHAESLSIENPRTLIAETLHLDGSCVAELFGADVRAVVVPFEPLYIASFVQALAQFPNLERVTLDGIIEDWEGSLAKQIRRARPDVTVVQIKWQSRQQKAKAAARAAAKAQSVNSARCCVLQ